MTTNAHNQNITLEELMRQEGHVSAFPTAVKTASAKKKTNTQIDYSGLEPFSPEEDLDIPTLHPEAQGVEETSNEAPAESAQPAPTVDVSAVSSTNSKDKMIHELQKEISQLREQVRVLRKESSHQKNCNKALRSILKQSGLLEDPNAKTATKSNWIGSLVSSFKH